MALSILNLYLKGADMLHSRKLDGLGTIYKVECRRGAFPHPSRSRGYSYQGVNYPLKGHYDDSSASIFIPTGFNPKQEFRLIFYFHGWKTTVDRSLAEFRLPQQVAASGDNIILIHPEMAKNAADGFGGHFEESHYFKGYLEEIVDFLVKERVIKSREPSSIVLAGHSGAYRVIAAILAGGGVAELVKEVYIFDGLYGGNSHFLTWIRRYGGRLVNIITERGGTQNNSRRLANLLRESGLPLKIIKDNRLDAATLSSPDSLFMFTTLGHEDVIYPALSHLLKVNAVD